MGLLDLIRGTQKSAPEAYATATRATQSQELAGAVAKIAVAPSTVAENSLHWGSLTSDLDSHCWPHSVAMNTSEIDMFVKRRQVFLAKGLDEVTAEEMANKLVVRDRDGDDRRVCFECSHLKGFTYLRCNNWKHAGIAKTSDGAFVHKGFGTLLQRCDGFSR